MLAGNDKSRADLGPLYTAANTAAKRRAESWLDANLKRGEKEKFGIVAKLTPELAEILLARNPDNRTVRRSRVSQISADLRDGRVPLNGEPIIVSSCGLLNDGQHRCLSVVETGIGYETFFSFGVERETRLTNDQGDAKQPGDYLSMDGMTSGRQRAAIAGYLWQIEKFGEIPHVAHAPQVRPTKAQIREAAAKFNDEIDTAMSAITKKGCGRICSYALACVAFVLIARRAGKIDAEDFMRHVLKGADLREGHPVLLCRDRLIDEKRKRTNWPNKVVEVLLRTWNMTRRRKRSSKLMVMGEWPEVEV